MYISKYEDMEKWLYIMHNDIHGFQYIRSLCQQDIISEGVHNINHGNMCWAVVY